MCEIDKRKLGQAKGAWNQWCDADRDRAPGDAIVDWLREATNVGVGVIGEYIGAGLELARQRAEIARAGRALLDDARPEALAGIGAKRSCAEAIAADADIIHRLEYYAATFSQEASFCSDAGARGVYSDQAERYRSLIESLGGPPPAPPMTGAEGDAAALLQFRNAKALVLDSMAPMVAPSLIAPEQASSSQHGTATLPGIQDLVDQLFQLHDLDGDGLLAEDELIRLNEKVALLHKGEIDKGAIVARFQKVFRDKLDPDGRPVSVQKFRVYMRDVLHELDPDLGAQEMMMEQFIAEAKLARDHIRVPSFQSQLSYQAPSSQVSNGDSAASSARAPEPPLLPLPPTREASLQSDRGASLRPPSLLSLADKVAQMAAAPSLAERAGLSPGHSSAPGSALGSALGSGVVPVSARAPSFMETSLAPPLSHQVSAASAPLWASKGEKVQVWSNSKNEWLDGYVEEAFAETRRAEGYTVPAGTLKVRSAAGVKWVRPGDESSILRKV